MPMPAAKQIAVDVTGFDKGLSSADSDLQTALETIDEGLPIKDKVSTTDATVTPIFTFAIPTDTTVVIMVDIAGKQTNGTGRLGHRRRAMAYREGAGAAAFQGGINTPMSKTGGGAGGAGWDATVDLSGNTLRVIVNGAAAADVEWTSNVNLTVAP